MTDLEKAWLAGILEGEGCFFFLRTPKVVLAMTDEDVIAKATGLMGCPYHVNKPREHQNKPVFCGAVHGEKALLVMREVLPFMGSRRTEKILEVMASAAARPGRARGERSHGAKISDIQAREIKAAVVRGSRKLGERTSDIARKYGISQSAVWYAVNKRYVGEDSTWTKK